jgi:hypothetical protein
LMEGKFRIEHEVEGERDMYKCTYHHPVNDYFSGTHDEPITISFTVPSNALEPRVAGNYARSENELIPLNVYGEVWRGVDRNDGKRDLILTPIAVY